MFIIQKEIDMELTRYERTDREQRRYARQLTQDDNRPMNNVYIRVYKFPLHSNPSLEIRINIPITAKKHEVEEAAEHLAVIAKHLQEECE